MGPSFLAIGGFCSEPALGPIAFPENQKVEPRRFEPAGAFHLREYFFETRDLGLRHAREVAEPDGAHLVQVDRITQRFVGNADLLGGRGYAVARTIPPALLFHFRLAHESLL